jgi:hypothetical protein
MTATQSTQSMLPLLLYPSPCGSADTSQLTSGPSARKAMATCRTGPHLFMTSTTMRQILEQILELTARSACAHSELDQFVSGISACYASTCGTERLHRSTRFDPKQYRWLQGWPQSLMLVGYQIGYTQSPCSDHVRESKADVGSSELPLHEMVTAASPVREQASAVNELL